MITEKAMLAAVHISIWTAVKHDRKVSRDVADQHGAHRVAGRYNKQLLRGANKLDELRAFGTILIVSFISRATRSTELRITGVELDPGAEEIISSMGKDSLRLIPRRPKST